MSFHQQVNNWVKETKSKTRRAIGGAVIDLSEVMLTPQLSITITGTYVEGKVPVLTWELYESFFVNVQGNFQKRGRRSLDNLINEITGENIQIGFLAPYARFVEYGTRNMPGRYFRRNALWLWPEILRENVRFVRGY